MSLSNQDLKSEIEYIKEMAQKGDKGPLNIGRALLWAGAGIIFYIIARFSMDLKWLMPKDFQFSRLYFSVANYLTLASLGIFLFGLFFERSKIFGFGIKSTAIKVSNSVWLGVFIGTFDFFLCVIMMGISFLKHGQIEDSLIPTTEYPAILGVLSFYFSSTFLLIAIGIAWLATAAASNKKWLNFFAAGCLIAAPISMFLDTMYYQNHSFMISLVLFCFLPAFLSLRKQSA